jgi:hypothetical protein
MMTTDLVKLKLIAGSGTGNILGVSRPNRLGKEQS